MSHKTRGPRWQTCYGAPVANRFVIRGIPGVIGVVLGAFWRFFESSWSRPGTIPKDLFVDLSIQSCNQCDFYGYVVPETRFSRLAMPKTKNFHHKCLKRLCLPGPGGGGKQKKIPHVLRISGSVIKIFCTVGHLTPESVNVLQIGDPGGGKWWVFQGFRGPTAKCLVLSAIWRWKW